MEVVFVVMAALCIPLYWGAARQMRAPAPPLAKPTEVAVTTDNPEAGPWSFVVTCRPFQWRAAGWLAALMVILVALFLATWLVADPSYRDHGLLAAACGVFGVYPVLLARGIKRYRIEVTEERARAVPLFGRAREFSVRDVEFMKPNESRYGAVGFVAFGPGKRRLFWVRPTASGYRELVA